FCIISQKQPMSKTNKIHGIHAIEEAIKTKQPIDKVFLQKGFQGEGLKKLEGFLQKNKIPVSYVPVEKLNRLVKGNHQGIVASISPIAFREMDELIPEIMEREKM